MSQPGPYGFVPRVPLTIGPPKVLPITITSLPVSSGGFDLTTATAVFYRVFYPDGTELATDGMSGWSGTILPDGTATQIETQHAFTLGDMVQEGEYEIAPVLTVPGGFQPCSSIRIVGVRIP